MSPCALDLLGKMLVFDPTKRITGTRKRQKSIYHSSFLNYNLFKNLIVIESYATFFAVEEALSHPYLSTLHDSKDEPVCPRPFSFDFEQPSFSEEQIKELIWKESVKFNRDP